MLIATAGHVDHGKTTLIKALTGVDTDKLPEEKQRGLSIDLGFAYTSSLNGTRLGFIDVPGHHKFIRNMIAGVGAIDAALLVVAADDGIMPQTQEHIAILDLLGVTQCVVALTRIDLVSDRDILRVTDEINAALLNTSLQGSPCCPVCAPNYKGIDSLKSLLVNQSVNKLRYTESERFRLAVDRVFTVTGQGTVVTGAVVDGRVAVGDSPCLLPSNQLVRVRSMHVNGEPAESAIAGQRVALNLVGVSVKQVQRGHWITAKDQTLVTQCVDVKLRLLDTEAKALRHWSRIYVHGTTSATTARVALYDRRSVEPGSICYAQLVLDSPQHCLFGDRLIIRDQGADRTLGCGNIVDPQSSRHRAHRKNRQRILAALDNSDPITALSDVLSVQSNGINKTAFAMGRNIPRKQMNALLEGAKAIKCIKLRGKCDLLLDASTLSAASEFVLLEVERFQLKNVYAVGAEYEWVRRNCGLSPVLFDVVVGDLLSSNLLERCGVRLRKYGYLPQLQHEDQALLAQLHGIISEADLKPPPLAQLCEKLAMDRETFLTKVEPLVNTGHVVRIARNRFFHPMALQSLVTIASDLSAVTHPEGFEAKAFRDASGIGRNLTIDVLEYFDRAGITRRLSNRRVMRL